MAGHSFKVVDRYHSFKSYLKLLAGLKLKLAQVKCMAFIRIKVRFETLPWQHG